MPQARLGQHFLKNPAVVKKIITAIDPAAGETIIEIGPGHGELTVPLFEVCRERGARLVAIERDGKIIAELENRLQSLTTTHDTIEIVSGNALDVLKNKPATKLVGNIPYYITGHLFRVIGELETKPVRCVFMIQKEVAERICAVPPKMNRLAASVQFWAVPKIIASVSKENFSPSPKVDSSVITLETREGQLENAKKAVRGVDADQYYAIVRKLFAQPRKTILNNLKTKGESSEGVAKALAGLGITSELRPQDLTIERIRLIAEKLG